MSKRLHIKSEEPREETDEFKEEYDEDMEVIHIKTENKGNLQCTKCGQQFTLSSNYRRHLLHNKVCGSRKEGFKCSNCHKQFSLNATLKDHYLRCTAEDPYRFNCPNCPKLFTFKSSLNKHLRGRCRYAKEDTNKKQFKCTYCEAEFFSYSAWRKHLNEAICALENNPRRHICPHCANRFTLKSSLNKHLKGRCKAVKQEFSDGEVLSKLEVVVDLSQENDEENVIPFEVITGDDIIEECPEWETFETEDVESYIEIANVDDEDENVYEFIKVNSREEL